MKLFPLLKTLSPRAVVRRLLHAAPERDHALPRTSSRPWERRRIPSRAALLFVVAVLLVFNLSNWRYLNVLTEQMREDLEARLRSVAVTAGLALSYPSPPEVLRHTSQSLPEDETDYLEGEFSGSPDHQALTHRLVSVQQANGLARVLLMTPSGVVVADSIERRQPGEAYEFLELDDREMRTAVSGGPTATPLYWLSGVPYMRLYAPLRSEGQLLGLVQVAVSPEYQDKIERLQKMVMRQWFVSSLLLLILGYSLWRLFRYLVRVEESAMQGARVDAMGALAGNVAHELRNPLSIIRALSEEITAEAPPQSVMDQNARDIVGEVERLNELVTNFLSLSRPPGDGGGEAINMAMEIERVLALLRKGKPSDVAFISELPSAPVWVHADEPALRQVLLNLLLNAREAVESEPRSGRGEVRVSLRERRGQAEIRILDNGPGFDRKAAARAFEPFYTTKPMGTGLGLAISRSIVENLGGRITLSSPGGRGAEVMVTLPVTVPGPGRKGRGELTGVA